MKFYIGVTDGSWFHFLARHRPDEVNFWCPRCTFCSIKAICLTVSDDHHLEVSRRIREEYENGREFYGYHGKPLFNLPQNLVDRPSPAFLNWHRGRIYKGRVVHKSGVFTLREQELIVNIILYLPPASKWHNDLRNNNLREANARFENIFSNFMCQSKSLMS